MVNGFHCRSDILFCLNSAEHILYLCLSVMRKQHEMQSSLKNKIVGCPTGRTISGSNFLIYGYGEWVGGHGD